MVFLLSLPYSLIRSKRRSLSLQISREGALIVRAPRLMPVFLIEDFIERKRTWIEKQLQRQRTTARKTYDEREIRTMKERLREYLILRVEELWKGENLPPYTSIKITKSEGRWGSCSARNGLCFSYRLAEYLEKDSATSPVMSTESPASVAMTRHLAQNIETTEQDSSLRFAPLEMTDTTHPPFIDAIIVHELAHLREKNHQKPFWNLVYHMMPEYESIMKNRDIEE